MNTVNIGLTDACCKWSNTGHSDHPAKISNCRQLLLHMQSAVVTSWNKEM
jgi:hypothetical protein